MDISTELILSLCSLGLSFFALLVAIIMGVMNYHHTEKTYQASSHPLLKISATISHFPKGNSLNISFQNLNPIIFVTDIQYSIFIYFLKEDIISQILALFTNKVGIEFRSANIDSLEPGELQEKNFYYKLDSFLLEKFPIDIRMEPMDMDSLSKYFNAERMEPFERVTEMGMSSIHLINKDVLVVKIISTYKPGIITEPKIERRKTFYFKAKEKITIGHIMWKPHHIGSRRLRGL